ncbi:aromatic amino acid ammonia-lyase [Sphaerisporangium aureirubrum]|uniref:Aromatic amino acid ammonia-lyase n=1 Tax=Sphaerisporangium aureirubrum TaxID=1544736 RepID=A0ABW1NU62_9ACTN
MASRIITLDGARIRPADIADIARTALPVRLDPGGLDRAAAARKAAEEIAARRPVYGRTTGVGANRTQEAADDAHGLRLLRSHAAGIGPPLPPDHVRAMLAVRANQILSGGGGTDPAFAQAMAEALNSGHLPEVHELGSLGTGDLTALAETALTLIGERPWASTRPEPTPSLRPKGSQSPPTPAPRWPGDSHSLPTPAPRWAKDSHSPPIPDPHGDPPAPVTPGSGDALAFCSSGALTVGQAALAWADLRGLLGAAQVVAALALLAVNASGEPYDEHVHAIRPHPGNAEVAAETRRLLAGAWPAPARIQDPFAYRCHPQVHGAALEALSALEQVLHLEINSAPENPLINAPAATVHHHGGFHLAKLTLTLDHLRLALLNTAHLSAARLTSLMDPAFTGLPAFLAEGPPGSSGLMVLEYSASSALADLRTNAHPASLGHTVLSRGLEEHASFASQSARQTLHAATAYRLVLACELVTAVRALRHRPPPPATLVGTAFAMAARELNPDPADRPLTEDVGTAAGLLESLTAV